MTNRTKASAKSRRRQAGEFASRPETLLAAKARFTLDAARAAQLLGGKTRVLRATLDEKLVAAAKKRTGISSDTELAQLALAWLAVGDDFGEWLVAQGGRLKAGFTIDL